MLKCGENSMAGTSMSMAVQFAEHICYPLPPLKISSGPHSPLKAGSLPQLEGPAWVQEGRRAGSWVQRCVCQQSGESKSLPNWRNPTKTHALEIGKHPRSQYKDSTVSKHGGKVTVLGAAERGRVHCEKRGVVSGEKVHSAHL